MQELNTVYYHYIIPIGHFITWLVASVGIVAVIGVAIWVIKLSYMYQDEKASRAEVNRLVRELTISNAEHTTSIKHIEKGQDKIIALLDSINKYVHQDMHNKIEEMAQKMLTISSENIELQKKVTLLESKSRNKKSA